MICFCPNQARRVKEYALFSSEDFEQQQALGGVWGPSCILELLLIDIILYGGRKIIVGLVASPFLKFVAFMIQIAIIITVNDWMRPEHHNSTHYWGDETQLLYAVSPTNL
jgi:hypothetical protein